MSNPEAFANFYQNEKLGFDIKLVEKGFSTFKPYFSGTNCLELGPATGYMTRFLINSFSNVTVVEGSKSLIDQIPDYNNLKKINCLFEEFTPTEKFDTIIINHVLEHLEDPVAVLKNAYEWLNDEGVCIVGVPNAKSFHRLAAVKMGLLKSEFDLNSRDLELGHYRVYDLELLKNHMSLANFKINFESGLFLKFLSNAQIERFLDNDIVEAYFELAHDFYKNSAEIFVIAKK
jgi:2-polyprenyl-3-methyl-5-hydroxy-6-metoxy-1,4-benzoquinol methylase